MQSIIKHLKKNKAFLIVLFGLFIGGLGDFLSTNYLMGLNGFYESNGLGFYIPFLSTFIFSLILFIDRLILKDGFWFKFIGIVLVLYSFSGLVNNLNVYINVMY
jgi:hypothetical protein